MRRIAVILLVLVGVACLAALAAAGAGVALSRGWQRERLRGALEEALANELGAEVAIGALEGPLAPQLALRDLRIGPRDAPSLEAQRLSLEWDPRASWDARELVIRSLALERAQLFATRDAQGRTHAPGLLPEDPEAEPLSLPVPLVIDRTALEDLHVQLTWEDVEGAGELDIAGRAELGAVRWTAEGSKLPNAALNLDLTAGGDARRWLDEARLEIVHADGQLLVEAVAALAPAFGRLELRARGDLHGTVEVQALRLEGGDTPPLALARPVQLRRDGDRFVVRDLEIRSADQSLLLAGAVSAEGFEELHGVARNLDASLVARLAGAPGLAGRLSGEATLDGELTRPSGRASIVWRAPEIDGWTGERIDLDGQWDARSATLTASITREGRSELSLDLSLPLDAGAGVPGWERLRAGDPEALPSQLRLAVRAEALDLAALSRWLPDRVRALRGELTGDLGLVGGPHPRAEGRLALGGLGIELEGLDRPIEIAGAQLEIGPDPAGIRLERLGIEAPGLRIETTGALGLAGPRGLAVRARIADLEAFAAAHGLEAAPPGTFEALLRLDGAWRHPSLEGSLDWRDPAPGIAGPSRVDVEFASQGAWLSGELRIWQDERIAAHGELRHPYPEWPDMEAAMLVGPGAELVVHAEDFELATFAPLLGRRVRDLRGRVDASVSVRGGAEGPSLEGTLRARDGSLRVPVLRQTFEPIGAEIAFRDDLLRIERLRIGREGAHAELSGTLRLDAFLLPRSAELEAAFVRFPVSRSPVLSTDVDGRVLLAGPLDAPSVRGALALSEVRVRLADPGDPALREIQVITSDAARGSAPELVEGRVGPSAYDRAEIDLELTVPRGSWVRGRGANLELAGALQLDKASSDALRISGDVSAQRGAYRFQGRRFDVRRGTVTFDGGIEPDPLLDVEARRRVGDVVVIVTLSGRLSEPIVRLSSEPDLPEDDVLAYLVFGRPARDLRTTGAAPNQLEAAAGAFAAGIALGEASGVLEDLVPIDSFDVEMREDGRSADLSVGKYLTDDVFVTYERRLGSDPIDGVRIHLRLGDNWSIATDAATDESAGADLIWSLDY